MSKIKIIVAGIGGVGGYFGGLLAKHFEGSNDVEIYFVARGEHLEKIRSQGLKVIIGASSFMARPTSATDNPAEIGTADLILVCTKSYDLRAVTNQLKPCVDENTFVLPLLNGVDSNEIIQNILPGSCVLQGCVYVLSYIKEPGTVENSGNIETLYFGLDNVKTDHLLLFGKLFKEAGIKATLSDDISSRVWEKFHFVGANSTATSYYDSSAAEILGDETRAAFVTSLIKEVNQLALAKGIELDKEIVADTMKKIRALPVGATSSMQRDFKKANGKTELETITGYVVRESRKINLKAPAFETAYQELKSRHSLQSGLKTI